MKFYCFTGLLLIKFSFAQNLENFYKEYFNWQLQQDPLGHRSLISDLFCNKFCFILFLEQIGTDRVRYVKWTLVTNVELSEIVRGPVF